MVLDTPRPLQVRETQNDHWHDDREARKAGEVFDGGALVEGSGQVVMANHCCCLMRPRAWEDLSLSMYSSPAFPGMYHKVKNEIYHYYIPARYSIITPLKSMSLNPCNKPHNKSEVRN